MSAQAPTAPPIDPALKVLRPVLAASLTLGSLAWSADLYRLVGLVLFPEQFLSAMLGMALALVYLHYPARRNTRRGPVPWYDWVAAAMGFGAGWYVAIAYPDLADRLIEGPPDAVAVSVIFIALGIEGLRRTIGYSLVVIVLAFMGYALIGHLVPGDLQTREVRLAPFATYLALDTSALLGFAMVVGTTIVLTFVFFGQLLVASGASGFFNDIAQVLMGRYRGGSAKIAIAASSLFGTVSGVAVSNIVATGVVTIPLMKRAGFSARFAASVEAVASTGGQLMPPVMGAVAFIMADFLEMAYRDIMIAALVPSLLYYVALFIQADLTAARAGILGLARSELPKAGPVLRDGWPFVAPFAALIWALFWLNWTPGEAAILASLTVLAIGLARGYDGKRMAPVEIWRALVQTGIAVLDIIMIVAAAGFIIGVLNVTGLGFAFTLLLVEFGGGNLFLLLVISGLLCIVLGMGMPTVGVYILLAVLIAPSLVEVGVSPLAAHMFILYLGMMSLITPPVAVAAFFAASIARAPPMATGWYSMKFGWTAYVVPFLFVFSPSLLLQGSALDVAVDVATALGGVWLVSAAIVGYFARALWSADRLAFAAAGTLLLLPRGLADWVLWCNLIGLAAGLALVARDITLARRAGPPPLIKGT